MPACPVCDKDFDAYQGALEAHVNSHFTSGDDPEGGDGSGDHDVEFLGMR